MTNLFSGKFERSFNSETYNIVKILLDAWLPPSVHLKSKDVSLCIFSSLLKASFRNKTKHLPSFDFNVKLLPSNGFVIQKSVLFCVKPFSKLLFQTVDILLVTVPDSIFVILYALRNLRWC